MHTKTMQEFPDLPFHVLVMQYINIGREIGGAEGAQAPPTLKDGGLSLRLIFQGCILFSMPYTIKEASKLLSEGLRNTLRELKIPNFPGGACPQTPLDDFWLLCLKFEPPHFCRSPPLIQRCGNRRVWTQDYTCTHAWYCAQMYPAELM